MKRSCSTLIALFLLAAITAAGQSKAKPRPTSFIETRQGNHPDGPDVIGHGKVSKGDTLLCKLVEVYDKNPQSSTACMIRFGDGPQHTLEFNQSMPAPQDSDACLECAGDKPRRCMLEVNPEPASPAPAKLIQPAERVPGNIPTNEVVEEDSRLGSALR